MSRLVLFNKPYGVLSQFTDASERLTLADHLPVPGVYVAGRLDRDSEGLLALTDDGALQARISHPRHKQPKTYWAQVEGVPDEADLESLRQGVELSDGRTLPADAQRIAEPAQLWPRDPPIRYRAAIPTAWLAITLREGRNRQIRRMTSCGGSSHLAVDSLPHRCLDAGRPGARPVAGTGSRFVLSSPRRKAIRRRSAISPPTGLNQPSMAAAQPRTEIPAIVGQPTRPTRGLALLGVSAAAGVK